MHANLSPEQRERRHREFLVEWDRRLKADRGHKRSWWTQAHQDAADAMAAYHPLHAPTDDLTGPWPPWHAQTPGAERAREAMRVAGRARRQKRHAATQLDIVGTLPVPWREVPVSSLVGAPATFARNVIAAGGEVKAVRADNAVTLVVRAPRIRATWVSGRTKGVTLGLRKLSIAEALAAIGAAG